jgi:ketosteroid isomerase-like protein
MSTSENNKAIVQRFFKAMSEGDVDTLINTYAEDGTVRTMGNTLISGTFNKDQIRNFAGSIYEVFPQGLTFTILGMTAEGERVAVEAESQGEHVSGKHYNNEYHFLFEFRDGELVSLREYMDTEHLTDVICNGQRPPFEAD